MEADEYLAHIADDGRAQTIQEHLEGTARLCAAFAAAFDAEGQGWLAAMRHDIGKYTMAFQQRLHGASIRVDHSTAGMFECVKCRQLCAAFAVSGHHGGIPNGGGQGDHPDGSTFWAKLNRAKMKQIEDYSAWPETLLNPPVPQLTEQAEAMFFIRMLYSCLVDADYLDTEAFMRGMHRDTSAPDMETLLQRFQKATNSWFPPKGELNRQRCAILEACMEAGRVQEMGLCTLTVPTGGGKTAASLGFALQQAVMRGFKRIVYVIPYTSIIEQTAGEFRKWLGDDAVLEHHSGLLFDDEENETPASRKLRLATENWDMPVVVTTAVQFFESLYANTPAKCRKLHNLAQSVVIFDEAQMLPLPMLRPCVWAITQLVKRYHTTAVLCTATQPALGPLLREFLPGFEATKELCPKELSAWTGFRRVRFAWVGVRSWDAIAAELNEKEQVLCIVNHRKSAQKLAERLQGEGVYHLSTLMYPAHRQRILKEIRKRLNDGLPCKVVSTSLIEAGVDVDFPAVYREAAGLDSILQAAGRCNREGKYPADQCCVTVFQSEERPPMLLRTQCDVGQMILEDWDDPSAPEAIHAYFRELLELKGAAAQDAEEILMLQNDKKVYFPFAEVATRFRMIDQPTKTIYIPDGEGAELVARLQTGERSRNLFRQLGLYGVSVYHQHFQALLDAGTLDLLEDGSALLRSLALYDEAKGLTLAPPDMSFLCL